MNPRGQVAHGIAYAMLAGPWAPAPMRLRVKAALGRRTPPKWLPLLVDQVLAAYRDAPVDRPRELAAFVQTTPAWAAAWRHRRRPQLVRWTVDPTGLATRPWPVAELPDLGALAQLLAVDQGELAWFADTHGLARTAAEPLQHYRWTTVTRPHGVRLVAAPKPRLKEIQRRVLRHVLEPIPVHPAAHGCVRGRSVRSALEPHVGRPVIVRADLEAFFPAISAGRVWGVLRTAGLPEAVAHAITGLVTTEVPRAVLAGVLNRVDPAGRRDSKSRGPGEAQLDRLRRRLIVPHLPVGAPTSPALGNLVAYCMDRRLAGLADRFDARYTRYVDDLTFSGGLALRRSRSRFVAKVDEVVRDEGFRLNDRKTVALGDAGRQSLLGAVVNHHPTVARTERDALRATLHNCATYGWRSQLRGQDDFAAHLLGRIPGPAGSTRRSALGCGPRTTRSTGPNTECTGPARRCGERTSTKEHGMPTATWNGETIAQSDETVVVEGNQYFPLDSVKDGVLSKTDTTSVCPWKGTASYYSVSAGGDTNVDAAWYYPAPKDAAKEIKDHVAFWKGVEVSA